MEQPNGNDLSRRRLTRKSTSERRALLNGSIRDSSTKQGSIRRVFPGDESLLPLHRRILHWGPILAVCITAAIGLTTTVVHVSSWWALTEVLGIADLSTFLMWNYLTLYNMLQAAFHGGGHVPRGWRPSGAVENVHQRLQYCVSCKGFKAPRSHHCSKCERCVMKMDHHCPWINNCVGHRNHVFFIRFLLFAVIGSLHACILLIIPIYETVTLIYGLRNMAGGRQYIDEQLHLIDSIYVFMGAVMGASLACGVAIALSVLLVMQLKTAFTNKTGIEAYICEKAEAQLERPAPFLYPYDLGWRENWRQVWNNGRAFPRGNGLWWPIRHDCTQFTFSMEQLEQKRLKREWLERLRAEGLLDRRPREESFWKRIMKWLPRRLGLMDS